MKDKQSAEYLKIMDAQIDKLLHLIEDLLDVTRTNKSGLQYHEEFFESNELIEKIVREIQLTTDKHSIKINLDKSQLLFGDKDRIGQVLTNLLSNAIKYSPSANKIIVRTKVERSRLICSVQDFGIGIPRESLKNLFHRFYRVYGPHEDTFSGLGLGLFLSSEIIKRHRGKIWVKSKHRHGSTFFVSLPIPKKKPKKVRKNP